ncbi:hydrogenase maturation protease [Methylocystis sp. 9N]|uniref:Hydrogenase maturation protease n=1 Tax=Methylocystis borbori TaxID=3118750 RepID=A0ABU7XIS2_9HYPH
MSGATRPRWLIFGVGNPSRGDDALGPMLVEKVDAWRQTHEPPVDLTLLTDFQWQIEHALDLRDIDVALFVDASRADGEPVSISRLAPRFDATHSTHALSPACVLAVAEKIGLKAPQAWIVAVAGEDFGLGAPLSDLARRAFDSAYDRLLGAVIAGDVTAT